MTPWLSFLKWILQPKNALLVVLTILVILLAIGYSLASGARDRAKGQVEELTAQNLLREAQIEGLRANIESIKKLAGKVQVIERNTHTISEIVNRAEGACESSAEIQKAAGAVIGYFNSGRVPAGGSDTGIKVLPPTGATGAGTPGD